MFEAGLYDAASFPQAIAGCQRSSSTTRRPRARPPRPRRRRRRRPWRVFTTERSYSTAQTQSRTLAPPSSRLAPRVALQATSGAKPSAAEAHVRPSLLCRPTVAAPLCRRWSGRSWLRGGGPACGGIGGGVRGGRAGGLRSGLRWRLLVGSAVWSSARAAVVLCVEQCGRPAGRRRLDHSKSEACRLSSLEEARVVALGRHGGVGEVGRCS
jgi:hypothetical protein